jgi:diacylglycerol O-acyltransferase
MQQLSGADSGFLQFERGNNHMHIGALAIYDPSTHPDGSVRFKDVLRYFAARAAQFPQFRRRLVTLPMSLDRPWWVEAPDIDVEFHVRHIALPEPGDWRQLCIQVARLHSRPLDRTKPLWEAYVIEGLDNVTGLPPGSFAVYTKLHHAMVDGEAANQLMKALHTLTPEPLDLDAVEAQSAAAAYPGDAEPSMAELYTHALLHNASQLPSFARVSYETARSVIALGGDALKTYRRVGDSGALSNVRALLSGDLDALWPSLPPKTRFCGDVSKHRVFEAVSIPLADFRDVKRQVPLATVNDQFLCIVGGALRSYLSQKGELPETTMVASVPMTLRGKAKGDQGNQVGVTMMSVHTDIEDPLERLRAIVDSAGTSKRLADAFGKETMRDLLEAMPAPLTAALARSVKLPGLGLVVSNVRGPDVPLYLAGARLVSYIPISIAMDGMGLNVTGFSYAGQLWICAVSCRSMLPDPAFFAECLRNAFAQLHEAALREAAFTVADTAPVAVRASGTGRASGAKRKRKASGAKRARTRSRDADA